MAEQTLRIQSRDGLYPKTICYWKEDSVWWIYLPNCGIGRIPNHKVIEHEDGTITATPSILMDGHSNGKLITRHGMLIHGLWNEC